MSLRRQIDILILLGLFLLVMINHFESKDVDLSFVRPIEVVEASVSMYTSRPEETDDTPFITASGWSVQEGAIANNCLPFHTEVSIKGKYYTVLDRMNSRYGCEYFDIWHNDLDEALEFGRQNLNVYVSK